jgi:hypothetical protein
VSWLEDHHTQVWDKQIEEDLEAGRLASRISADAMKFNLTFPGFCCIILHGTSVTDNRCMTPRIEELRGRRT